MAGQIKITPQEFADKHARRLKASVQDIQTGIERVTDSPTAKAADKQAKMLQNVTAAIQSGKWAARLKSVSLEDWKAAAINKGLGRIASGIDGANAKMVAFGTQLLSFEATVKTKLDKMPDLTLEDSINRASTWMREMSKFQRK
jgi:hypothetical protein